MVLQILRGPEGVEEELKAIQLSLNQEKVKIIANFPFFQHVLSFLFSWQSHSFTDLCGGRDNMRARFLIACGLAVLQQVSLHLVLSTSLSHARSLLSMLSLISRCLVSPVFYIMPQSFSKHVDFLGTMLLPLQLLLLALSRFGHFHSHLCVE